MDNNEGQTTPVETEGQTPDTPPEGQDGANHSTTEVKEPEVDELFESFTVEDANQLFGDDLSSLPDKPSEEGGESEEDAEPKTAEEEPTEQTPPEGPFSRFEGLVTVNGVTSHKEIEGDELTAIVQKGLAYDELQDRHSRVKEELGTEIRNEQIQANKAARGIYDDVQWLLANDPNFKDYFPKVIDYHRSRLPSRTKDYGGGEDAKPETEESKRLAAIEEELASQKMEKAVSFAKAEIAKISKELNISGEKLVEYAAKNGYKLTTHGKDFLRQAAYAMIGEGKATAKPEDEAKKVAENVNRNPKVAPIPAGEQGSGLKDIPDLELDDDAFRDKMLRQMDEDIHTKLFSH